MMKKKRRREQRSMLPVHPDAAAIDIGATVHVAAVGPARDPEPVRSFGSFTGDLHRLADWFAQCGIKTVVMESTGVYWIPVYEILDQRGFEVCKIFEGDHLRPLGAPARAVCFCSCLKYPLRPDFYLKTGFSDENSPYSDNDQAYCFAR